MGKQFFMCPLMVENSFLSVHNVVHIIPTFYSKTKKPRQNIHRDVVFAEVLLYKAR